MLSNKKKENTTTIKFSKNNNLKQSIVFNTTTSPSKCNNGGNFTTPSQPITIINLSNSLIEEDNNTLPSIHLDSEESIQQSNDIRLPSISETLSTVLPSPRHSSPIRTVTSNNSNTGTNPFYQHSPVNNYTTFSHISCIDKPFIPNELLLPREHSFHLSGGIRKNTIYQRELRKVKERTKRYLGSWIKEQLVNNNELSNIPIVNTGNSSSSEISEINNVISFASVKDNEHLPSVMTTSSSLRMTVIREPMTLECFAPSFQEEQQLTKSSSSNDLIRETNYIFYERDKLQVHVFNNNPNTHDRYMVVLKNVNSETKQVIVVNPFKFAEENGKLLHERKFSIVMQRDSVKESQKILYVCFQLRLLSEEDKEQVLLHANNPMQDEEEESEGQQKQESMKGITLLRSADIKVLTERTKKKHRKVLRDRGLTLNNSTINMLNTTPITPQQKSQQQLVESASVASPTTMSFIVSGNNNFTSNTYSVQQSPTPSNFVGNQPILQQPNHDNQNFTTDMDMHDFANENVQELLIPSTNNVPMLPDICFFYPQTVNNWNQEITVHVVIQGDVPNDLQRDLSVFLFKEGKEENDEGTIEIIQNVFVHQQSINQFSLLSFKLQPQDRNFKAIWFQVFYKMTYALHKPETLKTCIILDANAPETNLLLIPNKKEDNNY
ncbi:hypothetical protein ABK040_009373 [Willaertia magna]